jgi:hypothetical protein
MEEDKDDTSMNDSDADDDDSIENETNGQPWQRLLRQRQAKCYSESFPEPPWSCAMRQAHQKGLSILAADVANKTVPPKKSHPSQRQRKLRRLERAQEERERAQEDPNFSSKTQKASASSSSLRRTSIILTETCQATSNEALPEQTIPSKALTWKTATLT